METVELLTMIGRGEDNRRQFKKNVTNADGLAADMVAFSNGDGGQMLIGVNDDASFAGLTGEDICRLNQLVSNTSSEHVKPAINPVTENILTDKGLVMLINIPAGINKPYQDKNGVFFISAPIRVFVFRDTVEIISPGHLPNNLTVDNIKAGNSNARNPTLASHASHILPYRGIGSGIISALEKYPAIDFVDDRDGNLFKVILKRT